MMTPAILTLVVASHGSVLWTAPWFEWQATLLNFAPSYANRPT